MRRLKNILFVFEDSLDNDAALARAADLAARNEAELTLVHAIEVTPGHEGTDSGWGELKADWQRQLAAMAEPIEARGIPVTTEVLTGIPFREIVGLVQRRGADLVVKAAARPGGPRGLLFGSLDLHLMRKCPCPVWVDKEREDETRYRRIMAAVDVSDTSQVGRAMTRFILDLATSRPRSPSSRTPTCTWCTLGRASASG